jgi:hypothetical protein
MSKKEFLTDENFVCDCCDGKNLTSFSCHQLRLDDEFEEKLAKEFSKKYLDFDDCSHKICYHCVAGKPSSHGIPIEEIKCNEKTFANILRMNNQNPSVSKEQLDEETAINYQALRIIFGHECI